MPTTATSATDGMCRQHRLDLRRRHPLAGAADEVADPSDDRQVALVVEDPAIAGLVPAVDEGCRGCLLVVEVPVEEEHVADLHLAGGGESLTSTPGWGSPQLPGLRSRSAWASWVPEPASVLP